MVVVRLTEFAWKLRSNIKKFQTKICCFFVAAGLVFSVFFFSVVSSVESSREILLLSIYRQTKVYELITEIEWLSRIFNN